MPDLPPERSILRRYSYSFAVWNATFFTAFNLTLSIWNWHLGSTALAVYSGLASVLCAIGTWVVVWVEEKVRLNHRGLDVSVRGAEQMTARLLESVGENREKTH